MVTILMNFFKDNGIYDLKNKLTTISSKTAVGKTSLLILLTIELISKGNNVLFLTTGEEKELIFSKLNKKLKSNPILKPLFMVDSFIDFETSIKTYIDKHKIDIIIIDSYKLTNLEYNKLSELTFNNNIGVITSSQLYHDSMRGEVIFTTTTQKLDIIIKLTEIKAFTMFENLRYFIGFWLTKPNRTLKIIKNRYGKDGSVNLKLNFN